MKQPALFLDRDDTLIIDKHYLSDPAQIELIPETIAGMQLFQQAGYRLILITNQSGIARGYFTEAAMHQVHEKLAQLLAEQHLHLDAIYFCPHLPDDNCHCRKPKPGMLQQALQEHPIERQHSIMVGDKPGDIEAGQHAGLQTILITHNNRPYHGPKPDHTTADLGKLAKRLLNSN